MDIFDKWFVVFNSTLNKVIHELSLLSTIDCNVFNNIYFFNEVSLRRCVLFRMNWYYMNSYACMRRFVVKWKHMFVAFFLYTKVQKMNYENIFPIGFRLIFNENLSHPVPYSYSLIIKLTYGYVELDLLFMLSCKIH